MKIPLTEVILCFKKQPGSHYLYIYIVTLFASKNSSKFVRIYTSKREDV